MSRNCFDSDCGELPTDDGGHPFSEGQDRSLREVGRLGVLMLFGQDHQLGLRGNGSETRVTSAFSGINWLTTDEQHSPIHYRGNRPVGV